MNQSFKIKRINTERRQLQNSPMETDIPVEFWIVLVNGRSKN